MGNRVCVIIFVKSPEKGTVKSRLAASIGDEATLALYKCFVGDLIAMLRKGRHPFVICFYPPDTETRIQEWLGKEHTFIPQAGEDLGERMKNAFIKIFSEGFTSAVLIGSDSPDLPNLLIDEAFKSLRDHDAVVGPSFDGGYYLIGFNRHTFAPDIFEGIEWSAADVFTRTIDAFKKLNRRFFVLAQWRDIDTVDDLRAYYSDRVNTALAESATMKYLQSDDVTRLNSIERSYKNYERF